MSLAQQLGRCVIRDTPTRRYRYKVESGIPCPPKVTRGGHNHGSAVLYPFPVMAVDQSFFIPLADMDGAFPARRIGGAVNSFHQEHDERFSWRTRTLQEHGEEGWRVWRIK
jgi:hypothetical protein